MSARKQSPTLRNSTGGAGSSSAAASPALSNLASPTSASSASDGFIKPKGHKYVDKEVTEILPKFQVVKEPIDEYVQCMHWPLNIAANDTTTIRPTYIEAECLFKFREFDEVRNFSPFAGAHQSQVQREIVTGKVIELIYDRIYDIRSSEKDHYSVIIPEMDRFANACARMFRFVEVKNAMHLRYLKVSAKGALITLIQSLLEDEKSLKQRLYKDK